MGNISGLKPTKGRTHGRAQASATYEDDEDKREREERRNSKWAGAVDWFNSTNDFLYDFLGGDYVDKTKGQMRQGFDEAFPKTSQAVQTAADLLATGAEWDMTGGLGVGQIGMFLGPKAKRFPHDKADAALDLLRRGMSPEEVRLRTGIVFDSSGLPRFEIPDTFEMTTLGEKLSKGAAQDPRFQPPGMSKVLNAPELFDNYPQLMDYPTRLADDGGISGGFYPPGGGRQAYIEAYGTPHRTKTDNYPHGLSLMDTARHEIMGHAVDDIEGASMGATPKAIPKPVLEAFPDIPSYEAYRRAGGENWSNMVGGRGGFTAEQIEGLSPYHAPGMQFRWNEEYPRSDQWSQRYEPGSPHDWQTGTQIFTHAFDPAQNVDPKLSRSMPKLGKGGTGNYHGAQAQDAGGKLGPIAAPRRALLGDYPNTTAEHIVSATKQHGGNSVNIPTGSEPTDGLMVGMYRNDDPRNMVLDEFTPGDAQRFFDKNRTALQGEDKYYGTWFNPDDGKTYLDVSRRFEPGEIRKATKYGERTGQLAGFNRGTFDTFPIGNWREFVQGDEFAQRMDEMARYGGEFLDQYPTRKWWDMHGTVINDVYGDELMPQFAGFTGSTAPNTKPKENLQVASEYMRRYIAGEPIVQPDWRMPEDGMTFKKGGKMPMERSRVGNLERAARGEPLSGMKVERERRAMTGDPNAVVLDRHHIRLSEKPEAGIYANSQEGFISDEDYAVLEKVFQDAAGKYGFDPRDFSADTWTGIRETIRNKNELYGMPFKGSAIQGESKAYADVFDDLVDEKASFLGVSRDELVRQLRTGKGNLMSVLPLIPGGLALLEAYSGLEEEPVL